MKGLLAFASFGKCPHPSQSGRSVGVKLDGPNESNWTVMSQTRRPTSDFDPCPSTLARKTVHYRPGPSTLAQMTVQFGSKFFENFHQKCLSLKCSDLLGAGSGRPLIWFKRCANVEALILDRSLDAARCSPVRNRYVSDKNSDFDENHKFFSKIFFFKILLPKVHTYYTDQF